MQVSKCDICGEEMYSSYAQYAYKWTATGEPITRRASILHGVWNLDICEECHLKVAGFMKGLMPGKEAPTSEADGYSEKENGSFDPVNRPRHYVKGSQECIDWIESMLTPEEFRGYLKGATLKYMWRFEDKGKPVQDLGKAGWYIGKLKENVENREKRQEAESYILSHVDLSALYGQLAEEAAELAQASLKLQRCLSSNPPAIPDISLSKDETYGLYRKLAEEELTDVSLCAELLGLAVDQEVRESKLSRWERRLRNGLLENLGIRSGKTGGEEKARKI